MSFRLDRHEFKFVITPEQRSELLNRLQPYVRADENATETAYYPIVSLYYDTEDRDCYWEKVRGWPSRRKMRVRVYGSLDGVLPPTTFVEIKHKHMGRVVKRRARIPLRMALAVGEGDSLEGLNLPENDRRVVEEACILVNQRGFIPSCCMRYDRFAYTARDTESDLRITFDEEIAYRFDDLTPVPDDRRFDHFLLPPGYSVLEIKSTDAIPYWLTHAVGKLGCVLQSHSKYCNALEAGDPILQMQLDGKKVRVQYGVCPPLSAIENIVNRRGFAQSGPAAEVRVKQTPEKRGAAIGEPLSEAGKNVLAAERPRDSARQTETYRENSPVKTSSGKKGWMQKVRRLLP